MPNIASTFHTYTHDYFTIHAVEFVQTYIILCMLALFSFLEFHTTSFHCLHNEKQGGGATLHCKLRAWESGNKAMCIPLLIQQAFST